MDAAEVAARLYRVAPEDFVGVRDEAVAEARAAGATATAREIAAFRRPTRAAWLTNLLVAEAPDEVEGLLGLADSLAEAQRTLDRVELRRMSAQRSRLVGGLARRAATLGRDAGHRVDSGLEREVRAVLDAALADPELAARVRTGRLVRAERHSGFGTFGFGEATDPAGDSGADTTSRSGPRRASGARDRPAQSAPGAGTPSSGSAAARERSPSTEKPAARRGRARSADDPAARRERERAAAEQRERRERERALAEARERVERARLAAHDAARERDDAAERAESATTARDDAHRRVDELRDELDRARTAAADTERTLRSAERDAADAARRARRAETELSDAEDALDHLTPD